MRHELKWLRGKINDLQQKEYDREIQERASALRLELLVPCLQEKGRWFKPRTRIKLVKLTAVRNHHAQAPARSLQEVWTSA